MPERENRSGMLARRPVGGISSPWSPDSWEWNPWREMAEMRRRMDALFSGFFGGAFGVPQWAAEGGSNVEPDVDLFERDGEYTLFAALPGVKPEDVHVEATDNSVRLWAEYRSVMPQQDAESGQGETVRPHRQSRYSSEGRFEFSYTLPGDILADKARAEFNNGRLELHLPKAQMDTTSPVKQIPVITGENQAAPRIESGQTSAQPKPAAQKTTAKKAA
jgi:HSP20 family protein